MHTTSHVVTLTHRIFKDNEGRGDLHTYIPLELPILDTATSKSSNKNTTILVLASLRSPR